MVAGRDGVTECGLVCLEGGTPECVLSADQSRKPPCVSGSPPEH